MKFSTRKSNFVSLFFKKQLRHSTDALRAYTHTHTHTQNIVSKKKLKITY